MNLLKNITDYLKRNLDESLFRGNKFTSFMDNTALIRTFKQITPNQIQTGYLSFDAVLNFEEWPYRELDPVRLFTLINIWLEELPESQTYQVIEQPEIDIDVIDEEIADVTISIKIKTSLYIIEDTKGSIQFKNKKYKIEQPEIWYQPEKTEVIAKYGN